MARGYRKYRRNQDGSIVPHSPKGRERAVVDRLAKEYNDYHWGMPATKVFRVRDALVPNVIAYGPLEELHLANGGNVDIGDGSWVAWDPKHPRKRIHLVLDKRVREYVRSFMKHVPRKRTELIQKIARRAGGKNSRFALPKVRGLDLGVVDAIVYWAQKKGEPDEVEGTSYIHEFGGDGQGGHKPRLAADVSGRLWLAGGDCISREAGITG